jgi:hypothetical protein
MDHYHTFLRLQTMLLPHTRLGFVTPCVRASDAVNHIQLSHRTKVSTDNSTTRRTRHEIPDGDTRRDADAYRRSTNLVLFVIASRLLDLKACSWV